MFEAWLEESLGDPSALLHLANDVMIGERLTGCRKLQVAAAWADCHGAPDGQAPAHQSALVDRYVQLGGRGTPLVSQDCAGVLGHAQQIGVVAATRLIADALTIRHRQPLLWQRVKTGQVWAWKAGKIAQASRHLSVDSSLAVDRQVTPDLELMAWGRVPRPARCDPAERRPGRLPAPRCGSRRPNATPAPTAASTGCGPWSPRPKP